MISLFLSLAAAASADPSATDLGWRRYTNIRYGYSTCYPSKLMTPRPAPDAGDGRIFQSAAGAELRVWARYAVDDGRTQSAAAAADAAAVITQAGGSVTYRRSRPDWTVVSGKSAATIFWVKVALRDGLFVTVSLTNPISSAAIYSAVAREVNACTTIGQAAF
ncbi:hypothetical protein [Sphingomonas rubra]|uniref:hypothetical protein n=1 Tax=Sphingomonas rubra TaxID=634430 RepID=UPI001160290B|nr:hypothetical protein [Sphingomonas rubra]